MIVVVLLFIWVIALTPFALRRLSEHQIATSVTKFRSATSLVRTVYPRLVAVASDRRDATVQPSRSQSASERRRKEAARLQRQIERRRQLLFRLVGGTGTSVVFGAVPHLHVLWVFSIVGFILTVAYVAVLAYLAQQPQPLSTMRRSPTPVRPSLYDASSARLAASGGGGPLSVPQMPRRPAFVVINPNS